MRGAFRPRGQFFGCGACRQAHGRLMHVGIFPCGWPQWRSRQRRGQTPRLPARDRRSARWERHVVTACAQTVRAHAQRGRRRLCGARRLGGARRPRLSERRTRGGSAHHRRDAGRQQQQAGNHQPRCPNHATISHLPLASVLRQPSFTAPACGRAAPWGEGPRVGAGGRVPGTRPAPSVRAAPTRLRASQSLPRCIGLLPFGQRIVAAPHRDAKRFLPPLRTSSAGGTRRLSAQSVGRTVLARHPCSALARPSPIGA